MEQTINLQEFVNILNNEGVENFAKKATTYKQKYYQVTIEFDKEEVRDDSSEYDGIKFFIPGTNYHLDFKDEDDPWCSVSISNCEDSFGRGKSTGIGIGEGLYEEDKLEVICEVW